MSQNIEQIYVANPITTNASTDLMYFGQSPYGATDDAAMTYSNFHGQMFGNLSISGNSLISTNTNGNINLIPNGTGTTVLTHTMGGLAPLSGGVQIFDITNAVGLSVGCYSASAGNAPLLQYYKSHSTVPGSYSAVSSTDILGKSIYFGDDGSAFTQGAVIASTVTGTVSSGVIPSNLTFSTANTSGVLTLGMTLSNAQILTLANPLPILSGGTGVTSPTTSPTANAYVGWDANKNISANNFIAGFATTATAATTTTLTVSSAEQQYFTGSTTQTVAMPVVSTLSLGQSWVIVNNSSGVVTVQSSGGNTIVALASGTQVTVTCILITGTTAASWNASYTEDTGAIILPGTTGQLAYYAASGQILSGISPGANVLSALQVALNATTGIPGITIGTWTPTMTFGTVGDLAVSYVDQEGNYVKIGNLVTVTVYLVCTPTFLTSSGVFYIDSFPFTSSAANANVATNSVYAINVAYTTSGTGFFMRLPASASRASLQCSVNNGTPGNVSTIEVVSGTQITLTASLTYLI